MRTCGSAKFKCVRLSAFACLPARKARVRMCICCSEFFASVLHSFRAFGYALVVFSLRVQPFLPYIRPCAVGMCTCVIMCLLICPCTKDAYACAFTFPSLSRPQVQPLLPLTHGFACYPDMSLLVSGLA